MAKVKRVNGRNRESKVPNLYWDEPSRDRGSAYKLHSKRDPLSAIQRYFLSGSGLVISSPSSYILGSWARTRLI